MTGSQGSAVQCKTVMSKKLRRQEDKQKRGKQDKREEEEEKEQNFLFGVIVGSLEPSKNYSLATIYYNTNCTPTEVVLIN